MTEQISAVPTVAPGSTATHRSDWPAAAQALPQIFDDRETAIKALKDFAKDSGHKLVMPIRSTKSITFRCKAYKVSNCTFKVNLIRQTVKSVTSSSWTLSEGKRTQQIWKHTCSVDRGSGAIAEKSMSPQICPVAGAASSHPTDTELQQPPPQMVQMDRFMLSPAQASERPSEEEEEATPLVAAPRESRDELSTHVHHRSAPQQTAIVAANGHVRTELNDGSRPSASVDAEAITTNLFSHVQPNQSDKNLHTCKTFPSGETECPKCIPGSGKAKGHRGPHKVYIDAKARKADWTKRKALQTQHASGPLAKGCADSACVPDARSRREVSALQEALQILPKTFKDRATAAAAMRSFAATTGMNIVQSKHQNGRYISWLCSNLVQCRCGFKVSMHRPMLGGVYQSHWVLNHHKCTWLHAMTCYSAPTPHALDVAKIPCVREYVTAFKTLGSAKENLDSVARYLESKGIQIPRQSGNQDRKDANDQQRKFCLRVCARVLGYDDDGLSRSLRKLFPWCASFRDSGIGDSHLETRDGEFVAVVITWHTSAAIVAECGFRVVALDAATFEYMRKDLRLFILVGYTSNNTLMPLAMMIAFNEDLPAYMLFFRTLKKFSLADTPDTNCSVLANTSNSSVLANANGSSRALWTFLDNKGTSVIADQGPLRCTRKAFNQVFEHAELRSCSRHIIQNCMKRAQALDADEQGLLYDLAGCDCEVGVASLLCTIKERSTKLYDYILLDDHYTHWVQFYLRDTFDGGKGTSNGAEQFFSAAKAHKFRQLLPLDSAMEITAYVGELQRDFFMESEKRLARSVDSTALTEYVEDHYAREKKKASFLHMVGVPHITPFNVSHRVSCCEAEPHQGYAYHTISSNPPTEAIVRFEQQDGCPIVVTCTSARCKRTWTSNGYVCRHACVVGAHAFPSCGKLIERDNGVWWLQNMVRKEYHCATIRGVLWKFTPTVSPPTPDDAAAGPLLRMPILQHANRADLKKGRYRAYYESSDKGRTPPKRKERNIDAEVARNLVLDLDESDACVLSHCSFPFRNC
jgi:hypothetical protein